MLFLKLQILWLPFWSAETIAFKYSDLASGLIAWPEFFRVTKMLDGEKREMQSMFSLMLETRNWADFHWLRCWTRPRIETNSITEPVISTGQVNTSSFFWICRKGIKTLPYPVVTVVMGVIELIAQHKTDAIHNPQLSFLAPFPQWKCTWNMIK